MGKCYRCLSPDSSIAEDLWAGIGRILRSCLWKHPCHKPKSNQSQLSPQSICLFRRNLLGLFRCFRVKMELQSGKPAMGNFRFICPVSKIRGSKPLDSLRNLQKIETRFQEFAKHWLDSWTWKSPCVSAKLGLP